MKNDRRKGSGSGVMSRKELLLSHYTMTGSIAKATLSRSSTAQELVLEMHKQYWIAGHKTGKKSKELAALTEVDEFKGNCNHYVKKGNEEIDCSSKHPTKRPSGNFRKK